MQEIVEINIISFALVYLLLIIVLAIMKKSEIKQSKLLFIASIRMTIQLTLAGFILLYIFENPHPLFTVAYIFSMIAFATHRIISMNKWMNPKLKTIIILSMALPGILILAFFLVAILKVDFFNAQYAIPISGMIMGNAMTGIGLGLKSFHENIHSQQNRIDALQNIGAKPDKILNPIINQSLETAILPSINSMIGMGIVALPGMMTGQILSGVVPTTAILYQISIAIIICATTCMAIYMSLNWGSKTLITPELKTIEIV